MKMTSAIHLTVPACKWGRRGRLDAPLFFSLNRIRCLWIFEWLNFRLSAPLQPSSFPFGSGQRRKTSKVKAAAAQEPKLVEIKNYGWRSFNWRRPLPRRFQKRGLTTSRRLMMNTPGRPKKRRHRPTTYLAVRLVIWISPSEKLKWNLQKSGDTRSRWNRPRQSENEWLWPQDGSGYERHRRSFTYRWVLQVQV